MSEDKKGPPKLSPIVMPAVRRITYMILPIAGAAILVATEATGGEFNLPLVVGLLCAGVILDVAIAVLRILLYAFVTVFLIAWLICSRLANWIVAIFSRG
jgi:hypothetical protein